MANLGMNFDARQHEPAGIGASQLPLSPKEGWPVIISDSEMKENANKTGGYLELTLQIIEGEHAGETGVYRLNLFHTNEQTVAIAYKQLSAICHVTGMFNVSDSAVLHNRPFRAVVGLQKVKVGEEDKGFTEVKGVLHTSGEQPGKAGAAPVAAAPAAGAWTPPPAAAEPAATTTAPPWGGAAAATTAAPPWASKS